jgi:hypothetical protein
MILRLGTILMYKSFLVFYFLVSVETLCFFLVFLSHFWIFIYPNFIISKCSISLSLFVSYLPIREKKRKRTGEKRYKEKVNEVQMGRSLRGKRKENKGKATGAITAGVKLGIKEKQQEKGEEEGCMERKVHIGNKWWKITTI